MDEYLDRIMPSHLFKQLFDIQLLYGECVIGINDNGDVELMSPCSEEYTDMILSGEFKVYNL